MYLAKQQQLLPKLITNINDIHFDGIKPMFTKPQTSESIEKSPQKNIANNQGNKLVDALNLYVQSIELNEKQPAWLYGNSIALAAQINRFDLGLKLQKKATALYPQNDEINRAIALLYEQQNQTAIAIQYYQDALKLNPEQPEWVYVKLFKLLTKANSLVEAQKIQQQGLQYFPQSKLLSTTSTVPETVEINLLQLQNPIADNRNTPPNIEQNVDLNIAQLRSKLMDSALVEQYEILLEQALCHLDGDRQKIDPIALIRSLAEIKTDLHYLKTKLFPPAIADIDPQAKSRTNLEQIVSSQRRLAIKCDLNGRVVGSGWHAAEKQGRWTGAGTLSSIVLPYPREGRYRLEIIVKGEAKPGLLNTLQVHLNDRPIKLAIPQNNATFPAIIQGEVVIDTQLNESFLAVDLAIAETVAATGNDSRLIGLLVASINLIPLTR